MLVPNFARITTDEFVSVVDVIMYVSYRDNEGGLLPSARSNAITHLKKAAD